MKDLPEVTRGTNVVSQEPNSNFWGLVLRSGCSTKTCLSNLTISLDELLFSLTFLLACVKGFPLACNSRLVVQEVTGL